MRRALGVLGLVALGVLAGFFIRLVWPRSQPVVMDSYRMTPPQED